MTGTVAALRPSGVGFEAEMVIGGVHTVFCGLHLPKLPVQRTLATGIPASGSSCPGPSSR